MKTIADYNREISQNPNDAEAYNDRGITHRNKGNYEQAISDLTKSIQINPDNIEPYYNRGLAYIDKGEIEKAFEDYNKVIQLDPQNAEAYAKRGLINSELGNTQEAINDFEEFLRLDPQNKNAKLVRDGLKKLKRGESLSGADSFEIAAVKKKIIISIVFTIVGIIIGILYHHYIAGGIDFSDEYAIGSFIGSVWACSGVIANITLIPAFFRRGRDFGIIFGGVGITLGCVLGILAWLFLSGFAGIILLLIRVFINIFKLKKLQRNG